MSAAKKGHVELLRALIEAGAEVRAQNRAGATALAYAAEAGRDASVRPFLSEGAAGTVNACAGGMVGKTALMFAAGSGDAATARGLRHEDEPPGDRGTAQGRRRGEVSPRHVTDA